MFRTFNMGIGMTVVCDDSDKDKIRNETGNSYEIGRVVSGSRDVNIL
jgi:phosphoribosylaminoimidazole (AIR) synthetase